MPVWGAVVNGWWHHYSDRHSLKARQIALDPRVVVHLESGERVLIVEGRLHDLGHPLDHPGVMAALAAKYDRPGEADELPAPGSSYDALYRLEPSRALTWDLAGDATVSRVTWPGGDPSGPREAG